MVVSISKCEAKARKLSADSMLATECQTVFWKDESRSISGTEREHNALAETRAVFVRRISSDRLYVLLDISIYDRCIKLFVSFKIKNI